MTLKEYIHSSDVTGADLAKRIGVSAASITRIGQGGQNISLKLAQAIVDATNGAVTLDDLSQDLAA